MLRRESYVTDFRGITKKFPNRKQLDDGVYDGFIIENHFRLD